MDLTFTLNGKQVSCNVSADTPLFRTLMDTFNITSIKHGCSRGMCGNCVILFNGKPRLSCLIPVFAAAGQEIITYERFQKTRECTTIVRGFSDVHVMPCEYCAPSKMLIAFGILNSNPEPEKEEILESYSFNACSCVEPNKLVQGVMRAAVYQGRRKSYDRRK